MRREALAAVLLLVGVGSPALACKLATNPAHVLSVDERARDTTPPSAAQQVDVSWTRGRTPERGGCGAGHVGGDCGDLGLIDIQTSATDDRTSLGELGWTVTLAGGRPPEGLSLPSGAVRAVGWPPALHLWWHDGAHAEQEPLEFTLAVAAVDLAGNVGQPTLVVISDPGASVGCAVANGGALPAQALLVLLIVGRWRRARCL